MDVILMRHSPAGVLSFFSIYTEVKGRSAIPASNVICSPAAQAEHIL